LLVEDIAITLELANANLAIGGVAVPQQGMRVIKSGAISKVTHAIIDGIEGSYAVNYTRWGVGMRWIQGIRLVPDPDDPLDQVSLSGDSGAVWIERDSGNAVALHFAGEDHLTPLYEYALAQPIQPILDALEVELAI
jgi:hypothetical protein